MQYMFSCLVLGDEESALEYLQKGGLECGSLEKVSQWQTSLEFDGNEIDISFEIPLSKTVNYDDLIPMTDGILYFLNPNSQIEVEVFKEIANILESLGRKFPSIVIFKDRNNIIKQSSNELLNWIWNSYSFEAFLSDLGSENKLDIIIAILSKSFISGRFIINPQNSWLQIPFLFSKANEFIDQGKMLSAAQLVEKIAIIYKNNNIQGWTIYAEKAAWLYSESKNMLLASKIIEEFNPVDANRYKKNMLIF